MPAAVERDRTGERDVLAPSVRPARRMRAGERQRRAIAVALELGLFVLVSCSPAYGVPGAGQMRALALVVGDRGTGTAFHVGGGCWVTAGHVVSAAVVQLVLHDGQVQGAVVGRVHPSRDVALLLGPRVGYVLELSARAPVPGEPVWAVGFPGESRRYGQAVVVRGRVHVNSGDGGLLWVEGVVFGGHSGSPVLDQAGHVVGVVVGVHRLWLEVALAEPVWAVRQVLGGGCR